MRGRLGGGEGFDTGRMNKWSKRAREIRATVFGSKGINESGEMVANREMRDGMERMMSRQSGQVV